MRLESGLSVLLEIESATRVGQSVMLQPESQRSKRNQKNLINSQSGTLGTFSAAVMWRLLKTWVMLSQEGKWKHTDALATRVMSWMDQCWSKGTDKGIFLMQKHQFNEGFAVEGDSAWRRVEKWLYQRLQMLLTRWVGWPHSSRNNTVVALRCTISCSWSRTGLPMKPCTCTHTSKAL